eukprot:tig00021254_g19700.t1
MPSVAALVASPAVRRATGKKAPLSDDIAARSSSKTPDPSTGRPASRPRSSRSGKNQRMRFSEADGDGDGDEEAGEKQAARAESPATAGSERRAGGGSKKRFVGLSVSVGKHSDEEAAPAAAAASLPSKSTSPPQSPPSVSAAAGRSPGGIPSSPAMASAPSSRPTFKRMATFSTGKRQMTDYESALATAQARRESMWTTGATAPTSAALSPAGSLPGSPRGQRSATATQRERGTSIAGTSVAPHRAGIPSGAHIPSTSAHMGHRRGDLDANAAAAAAATAAAANAGGGMTFRHLPAALTARGGQQDNNQVVFEFMDSVLSQDTGGAAAALLEKGRASAATLFFGDAGFEREFRRDYAGEGIVRSRLCAVGALLICALLAGYALLLSDRPRQSALGYAGAAISAALALAVYASPLARRHPIVSHNLVTALFCLALVAGTSYTRLATTDTDAPMVAPVAIVALTVICRVLVSFSFFANLAMAGILLGTTAGYVSPLQALFHTVPPLEVIVLVLVIGRALEAVSRRNFLLGRLSRETQAMASAEKAKGDKILQSVLPESVIAAWKAGREQTVNRAFEEVTILFVALSNPPRTTAQNLAAVMPRINRYMSRLEDICDRHGVFRIKTIGFLFMAACGLPEERPEDHALAAARFARDALAMARDSGFSIKVGLHCGPIVAGLIGCRVFYDVFGDTVNVAQRMCYYAAPDSARFSARMHERVRAQAAAGGAKGEAFDFGPAEEMTIKGKGAMVTYPLRVPDSDDDEEDEEEGTSGESAAESGSEVPSSGSEAAAAPVAAEAGPAEAKRAEAVAGEGKVASPASVPALPLGAGPWQTSPSPRRPRRPRPRRPRRWARDGAAAGCEPARAGAEPDGPAGPAAAAAAAAAQPTAAQPAGHSRRGAAGAASRRSSAAKSRRTSQPEHSRRGSQPEHSRRGSQPEHGRSVRASRRRGSIMDAPAELLFGPGGAPHVEPAELRGEEAAAAAAAAVAPPAAGPLLLPGPRRRRRRRPAPVPPAASAAAVAAPPPVELPSSISDRIKRAATATVRSVMALARMPRVHSSLPLSPVQLRGVLGVLSRRPGRRRRRRCGPGRRRGRRRAVAAGAAPAKVGPTSPLASSSSGRSEGAGAAAPAKGEESGGRARRAPAGRPPTEPAGGASRRRPARRRAPDPSDPAWSRIVAAGPGGARAHRRRASLPHALPLAGGGPYLLGASRSFGGTGTARAAAEGARRRSDAPKSAGGSKIPSIDISAAAPPPGPPPRATPRDERRRLARARAGARTAARAFRSRSVLVGQAARKAPTLGASASPAARAGDDSLAAFLHVAGAPRALAGSPARGASPAPGPLNAAPGRGSAVASLPILRPLSSGEVAPLSPPFTVPASPPSHVPSPPLALAAAPAAPPRRRRAADAAAGAGPSGGAATARGTAGGAATARGTAGGAATARGTTGGGTTRRQSTTRTNRGNATARGGPLTARGAAPLTARGPRSSTLSPPPNDGATGTEASGPRQSYQSDRSRPSHVSLRSLSSARLSSPEGPPPAPAVPATPLNAPSSVVSGLGLGTVGALGTGGTAGLATLVVGPMANGKPRSTSSDLTLGANGGSARSRPGAAPRSAAGTSGRHVTLSDGGLSTARLSSRFKPPSVAGSLGAGVRPGSVPSLKALAAPSPQLQPARAAPPARAARHPASPARAAPVAPAPAEVAAPAPAPHAAEPALATGRKRPSPRHLAAMRGAVHCRFVDGALEAEFWDRVPRASLPDTRTVLALVFAHTLLWPAVQYGSGVPGDLPARLLVRYALQGTCVAAALALALFARAPFTRHARWVVNALSAVLVANAAISVLLFDRREAGAAAELAASFSYADLFIVLFIIHTFPGPVAPWLDTLVFDLALIGVSLASSGLARARPGRALLNLLLVEAICVSAAWFKELEARVEFLLDRELKAETEELAFECGETERLLQLCLPAPVALGVKDSSNGAKPTFYERVGVLTADIVGFTPLSSSLSAGELVDMLDTIYRKLDMLAAERNIHVLKTIGDAWIAVAGLDEPVSEEAMVEMVDLGAAVVQTFKQYAANSGRPVSVRVGIALASASGGIIGNKKWFWDLFGEAMEAAQRLESSSLPLRVHISRDVADCIADVFAVEPRYADPAAAPPALADLGDTFFVATSSAS